MARISSDSNCSEAARQNVTFISLLPSNSRINVLKTSSFNFHSCYYCFGNFTVTSLSCESLSMLFIMNLKTKQFLFDSGSIKVVFVILNS